VEKVTGNKCVKSSISRKLERKVKVEKNKLFDIRGGEVVADAQASVRVRPGEGQQRRRPKPEEILSLVQRACLNLGGGKTRSRSACMNS